MSQFSRALVIALANLNEFYDAAEKGMQITGPIHARVHKGCADQLDTYEVRLENLMNQERHLTDTDFDLLEKLAQEEIEARRLKSKRLAAERKRRKLEREAEIEYYRQMGLAA